MLEWSKLLDSTRRKDRHDVPETSGTAASRLEIERDYDRLLFASPTRRLADKTQVFPLDSNDSVRTRLTHSHEVSNLCRSIGTRLAYDHTELFGDIKRDDLTRSVPSLLAAIGLIHDLGNPPFGHQGEKAICSWFKSNEEKIINDVVHDDFKKFDGNAHTIRLLTRLQVLSDDYGLNLTYATLAALIKYPAFYDSNLYKKHGVFFSEKDIVEDVWGVTGLGLHVRHPLTYVMEACDDICYSVVDAEDTIKKGYASFDDLINYIEANADSENNEIKSPEIKWVLDKSKTKNKEFRGHILSPQELSDISMQMFRVFSVSKMVDAVVDAYVANHPQIMCGKKDRYLELIKVSSCAELCKLLKTFDRVYGFSHKDVLRLELKGSNYIKKTMDHLWYAIDAFTCQKDDPFANYVYHKISENYRRVFENTEKTTYNKCQLVCDAISGMTDTYLISFCDDIEAMKFDRNC
ncbi:MAG: dNTP triphosphohydrolase [Thalassolituus sp.]|uniref:deoxyguanosinetriphosphate triphosphohydrolase family protein n=1 Tax=Thalassolituus sp. TaxID=2030822 RepID=UPI0039828982